MKIENSSRAGAEIKRPRKRSSVPVGKVKEAQQKLRELHASRTHYYPTKRLYYYEPPELNPRYLVFTEEQLRKYLESKGYFKNLKILGKPPSGIIESFPVNGDENEKPSSPAARKNAAVKAEWSAFLAIVWEKPALDWVGEVAGRKRGLFIHGQEQTLIPKGVGLPVFKKGNCKKTQAFLKELWGGATPAILFQLRRALQAIQAQEKIILPAVILLGPSNVGKSCSQHGLITPLLGGRHASAHRLLAGATHFNKNYSQSEHVYIDDQLMQCSARQFREAIKRAVTRGPEETEAKGVDSYTTDPLVQLLTISMNDDPHNVAKLPPADSDMVGKFIAASCGYPKLTRQKNRKQIMALLQKELPAFGWWLLNEWELPAELFAAKTKEEKLLVRRFGCSGYLDPKYDESVTRESPCETLRHLVHSSIRGYVAGNSMEDYPAVLFSNLTGLSSPHGAAIRSIVSHPNYFGTLLLELAAKYPKEVKVIPTRMGRTYRLTAPEVQKPGLATSPEASADLNS